MTGRQEVMESSKQEPIICTVFLVYLCCRQIFRYLSSEDGNQESHKQPGQQRVCVPYNLLHSLPDRENEGQEGELSGRKGSNGSPLTGQTEDPG